MAVNGSVSPLGTLGSAGVRAIDTRTAGLTVSTVVPLIPLSVAVIVEVPVARPVARPFDPETFEMVATEVVAEAHVTWLVTSWVDPSPKVPVAVNGSVLPAGTLGVGRRHRDRLPGGAAVTIKTVEPITPSNVAEIVESLRRPPRSPARPR